MLHPRLAACMILLCLAAAATGPSAARGKGGQQAATRAYVETSYLIAPRQIGDFTLEGAQYDKDRKYAGAGFRYRVDGHQEIRVDIFVYPAGRMSQEAALDAGMQAFRTDLDRAVEAKAYDNLVVVDERDFPLRGDPPASGNEPGAPVEADEAAILEAIGAASRIEGRKLAMTLDIQPQGWPMHSSGHLFYKQLYYFKVRASAAQQRVSAEDFAALVDRAARTLVPAIEVANVGDCANSTITISTDAPPEEAAKALVTQAAVHQGYNCHLSAEDAEIQRKSADAEVVSITYQPNEWKSQ